MYVSTSFILLPTVDAGQSINQSINQGKLDTNLQTLLCQLGDSRKLVALCIQVPLESAFDLYAYPKTKTNGKQKKTITTSTAEQLNGAI